MLDSRKIKEYALKCGADLVGIASYDRFDGAPAQMDPRWMFPGGKSVIVMGFRHFRGVFRGIEEGTFWTSYCSMGYASINHVRQPLVLWNVCKLIEDEGYEAVPVPNNFPYTSASIKSGEPLPSRALSRGVSPERPCPNVFIQLRIAAFAAGMGDIGYSKMFLSPKFGPRQRLAAVITEAPLEPDPMPREKICDKCLMCLKACTVGAIPSDRTVKIRVAGRDVEWADIDMSRCTLGFQGSSEKDNPFVVTPGDRKDCLEYGHSKVPPMYFYARALEGAVGCIRACAIHLEEKGVIRNSFREPFRKRKPWRL